MRHWGTWDIFILQNSVDFYTFYECEESIVQNTDCHRKLSDHVFFLYLCIVEIIIIILFVTIFVQKFQLSDLIFVMLLCWFGNVQSEVNFLGRLSHPNLVKLLGYCWDDDELLLVYEFMPKGSLENHLFRSMNWNSFQMRKRKTILVVDLYLICFLLFCS